MNQQERKCLGCGARHIYPLNKSCSNGCEAGYTVIGDKTAIDILRRLMRSISLIHLDMGGKHRYALSFKSHRILTEANMFLDGVE